MNFSSTTNLQQLEQSKRWEWRLRFIYTYIKALNHIFWPTLVERAISEFGWLYIKYVQKQLTTPRGQLYNRINPAAKLHIFQRKGSQLILHTHWLHIITSNLWFFLNICMVRILIDLRYKWCSRMSYLCKLLSTFLA